jgi:hypothetical protein
MQKEQYAPWEVQHAQEQHAQQDREEWLAGLAKRKYLTRGQWFQAFGKRVTVPNTEARETRDTLSGRTLWLFSEDQTERI